MKTETQEIEIAKEIEEQLPDEAKTLIKVEYREIASLIVLLKVSNEIEYKQAVDLGIRNKDIIKRLENFRKAVIKPFQDAVKNTNDIFKKLSSRFEENQTKIDRVLITYMNGRKKQDEIKTLHDQDTGGRVTMTKRMNFEILDPHQVPPEWCRPDEVKIGRAVRGRIVREIPGVKIWEETVPSYSTSET